MAETVSMLLGVAAPEETQQEVVEEEVRDISVVSFWLQASPCQVPLAVTGGLNFLDQT